MIANTTCQQCSNVFETDGMSRTEFCPHCGKETSVFARVPVPTPADSTGYINTAATLKQIRQKTCYKTLRSLVDLVQLLIFVAAGVTALGTGGAICASDETLPGGKIPVAIFGAVSVFILIIMAMAWKQAALLLVDIADCQVYQAAKNER